MVVSNLQIRDGENVRIIKNQAFFLYTYLLLSGQNGLHIFVK